MPSHTYHPALPTYDAVQVLVDGCRECEARSNDITMWLAHVDAPTFRRAAIRAFASEHPGISNMSACEARVFAVLRPIIAKVHDDRDLQNAIGVATLLRDEP